MERASSVGCAAIADFLSASRTRRGSNERERTGASSDALRRNNVRDVGGNGADARRRARDSVSGADTMRNDCVGGRRRRLRGSNLGAVGGRTREAGGCQAATSAAAARREN